MRTANRHYKNVYTCTHIDEKYRGLSDAGKLMWLTVLTHPNLLSIGVMHCNVIGLAFEMETVIETVTETVTETVSQTVTETLLDGLAIPDTVLWRIRGFDELVRSGMVEYDRKQCIIALPNYLKHNPPENPNIVKSWQKFIDALPDCELKTRVIARCRAAANHFETVTETVRETVTETVRGTITETVCQTPSNPVTQYPSTKTVGDKSPTPPVAPTGGEPPPEPPPSPQSSPPKKKRRNINTPGAFPDEAKQVVRELLEPWPKRDGPDDREINTRQIEAVQRVSEIMAERGLDADTLIDAAKIYIGERHMRYCAMQHFFGPGKPGSKPAWLGYVNAVITMRERKHADVPA